VIRRLQFIIVLIVVLLINASAFGQKEELVREWLKKDVEGVSLIVELIPFERQNVEAVKARLLEDWHVEETDLGFGAKYLEVEKGWGYSKGYVHALIYNRQVTQYEAGIESYSQEWPAIKEQIHARWIAAKGPEVVEEEHGFVFRRTITTVLRKYKANVAATLGPLTGISVPPELWKQYANLIDPMDNATISGTHSDEAIDTLARLQRLDMLQNVLRAYNPGARVLAAIALLELEKSGVRISRRTRATIQKVLDLTIQLHGCVFDMCSRVTARQALDWFDSGRAFPKVQLPQRKP
jgi:hypothetical protein